MKGNRIVMAALLIMLTLPIGRAVTAQSSPTDQAVLPPAAESAWIDSGQGEAMPSLTESVLPSLSRIAISLCIIVAIIYATVFVLRKLSGNRFGGKRGSSIQIIEQTYLAPKKSVCLLKLADRAVLVGITDQNINLLTELEWEAMPQEAIERSVKQQSGFQGFLNDAAGRLWGGKNKGVNREQAV